MTTRDWGATGVTSLRRVEIDEGLRSQILTSLASKKVLIPKEKHADFFNELSLAGGLVAAGEDLKSQSTPRQVRENLDRALKAAGGMLKALYRLDGNSHSLLRESLARVATDRSDSAEIVELGVAETMRTPVFVEEIERCLITLAAGLEDAARTAQEYPQGRLPDWGRLCLAAEVADAMRRHIGVNPTSTRGGAFEVVLSVVLEAATHKPVEDVQDLARRALKVGKQVHPDGVVEYVTPPGSSGGMKK